MWAVYFTWNENTFDRPKYINILLFTWPTNILKSYTQFLQHFEHHISMSTAVCVWKKRKPNIKPVSQVGFRQKQVTPDTSPNKKYIIYW